ncbi:WYL domain-containing protein [Anaerobacillus isosaccharinicus]|uniref:WYL domain-containing protein n=1 Tax=Anaerobacillus isosaccharinicus TaxID=1532552 RepID=A0A1S2LET6_9BACI|nr:WYL domain-containing protein [Anaerobacillus isosaccharinicus]MBA5584842.1 WYL domain-containing protein [Anaerobacillus isosaccharinicus]QOY36795.1 WYL domain-containing protein [Anaerobacillus isosaccharinicus]
MSNKLSSKERVLILKELLERYTDEENELTIKEIINILNNQFNKVYGFNQKAVKEDLNTFENSQVIDLIVNQDKNGLPKYYSYQNRLFEIQELRLLIDAVVSARFITKVEKENIIIKIKKLTSEHLASKLENQVFIQDNAHSESSKVKYTIYNLHNAINDQKIIQFQYGRYNVDKEFILSRNKQFYYLHPYCLIWNNDYYYLIGWYPEEKELRHYRVDRMVNVKVTDKKFKKENSFDPSKYTKQLFNMYGGEEKWIEIKFKNNLINVIIDRFGKEVPITREGDNDFILKTKAVISDGLVQWLLTCGANAFVLGPTELKKRMMEESQNLYNLYQ